MALFDSPCKRNPLFLSASYSLRFAVHFYLFSCKSPAQIGYARSGWQAGRDGTNRISTCEQCQKREDSIAAGLGLAVEVTQRGDCRVVKVRFDPLHFHLIQADRAAPLRLNALLRCFLLTSVWV